jgi:hypothetical protein
MAWQSSTVVRELDLTSVRGGTKEAKDMTQFIGVGESLPEVTLPDLSGTRTSLSSWSGKKLLVFMWASW